MKKKLAALAVASIALFGLAACAPSTDAEGGRAPDSHYTFMQEMPDGGTVLCVWAKNYNAGGLSCDWEGVDRG